uniref:Uncharacterized protein n=1 Tax=Salix viminalis TaxID=40686 RepID=A0A6N2N5B0_SALVM
MEENNRNRKGGNSGVSSGKPLRTVTGKQLNVSARFDALMAVEEDAADSGEGSKEKEINENENGEVTLCSEAGRILGHKNQRADSGQGEIHGGQSPNKMDSRTYGMKPTVAAGKATIHGKEKHVQTEEEGPNRMDLREDGLKKPEEVSKANMHGPGKKQSRAERGK